MVAGNFNSTDWTIMSVSNGISQRLKDILVCLFLSGIVVSLGHSLYAEAWSGQGEATHV